MNNYLQDDIKEIVESTKDIHHLFEGKTILLSGGLGFLGRYFIATINFLNETILKKSCEVIVVDNLITAGEIGKSQNFQNKNVKIIKQDICQSVTIDQKIDYVVHAAGIASPFYYRAYPLETLEVAITGTKQMLELAKRNNCRFTFFSSSEIYGDPDPKFIPTPESYRGNVSCLGPRACYDEGKRTGETLCRIFHTKFGVTTNIIRPFNVYGPGMQEKDYRVLPNFASRLKSGASLKIYGQGTQTRTFCYITDAMNGFLRVITSGVPGEPYNIGNPKPEVSIIDLVKLIQEITKKEFNMNLVDYPDSYPSDEPMRRCPDVSKSCIQINYKPSISLEEGLKRFLSWTDNHYTGEM